jgi:hypothetical protein
MPPLNDQTIVVAGATGNVGPFVVRALLERGASVAAPSRSGEKLGGLREHLSEHVDESRLGRLHTFVGDLGDERGAAVLRRRITEQVGTPDAVVASVGDYVAAPSLLDARAREAAAGARCLPRRSLRDRAHVSAGPPGLRRDLRIPPGAARVRAVSGVRGRPGLCRDRRPAHALPCAGAAARGKPGAPGRARRPHVDPRPTGPADQPALGRGGGGLRRLPPRRRRRAGPRAVDPPSLARADLGFDTDRLDAFAADARIPAR